MANVAEMKSARDAKRNANGNGANKPSAEEKAKVSAETQAQALGDVAEDRALCDKMVEAAIKSSNSAKKDVHAAGVMSVFMLVAYGAREPLGKLYLGVPRAFKADLKNFIRNINSKDSHGGFAIISQKTDEIDPSEMFSVRSSKNEDVKNAKALWLKGGRDKAIARFEAVDWSTDRDVNNAGREFNPDEYLINVAKTFARKDKDETHAKATAKAILRLVSDKDLKSKVNVDEIVKDAQEKRREAAETATANENAANEAGEGATPKRKRVG